jgi:hypothetical protein
VTSHHHRPIELGSVVEVRGGLDRTWSKGFSIAAIVDDGYTIRRRSDGRVLPTTFAAGSVRHARGDDLWWSQTGPQ